MLNFLPISILGYALNGGATLIDKILLQKSLPHPIVYTFYMSVMAMAAALLLIPFGITINLQIVFFSFLTAVFGCLAYITYFEALKNGEASVVSPVVGALNPFFTFILEIVILNQIFTKNQILALFILLLGSSVLMFNHLLKIRLNRQLLMIVLS